MNSYYSLYTNATGIGIVCQVCSPLVLFVYLTDMW